ncbi:hypothetical protein [Limnoglobus roseus]|uniref:Uncharacterized protein n=1 Tax=Limnoglobus roseus TaxID=2598579 RepID=A0A5C1ANB8_9BACT|nr:hypothetical protein [Limnoglobus roseus]QEL18704.1 hypothetical protein PX52LOC_05740 [Limnoglobus roseus]
MIEQIAFGLTFAVLNRARGSKFFGYLTSTNEARALATAGMAAATALVAGGDDLHLLQVFWWTSATLAFWEIWGWGKYFAAIHGIIDASGGSLKPVDWLMSKLNLPTDTFEQRKRWGTVAMGLRQAMIAPCIVGLAFLTGHPERAWLACFTLLLGLPYYAGGKISQKWAGVIAETTTGVIISNLIFNSVTA